MSATLKKAATAITSETIAAALNDTFRGPAWYGPSVRTALRGVDAEAAAWRPAPGRNSIHELVLHLAYGRHRLLLRLEKLQGRRPAGRFPRRVRSGWFIEAPAGPDPIAWKEDMALLEEYQDRILAALADVDPATLALRRAGKEHTMGDELLGLAFHDAYHAGQIRLLALLAAEALSAPPARLATRGPIAHRTRHADTAV